MTSFAFVDAHNHLQDPWLDPHRERVLMDLRGANVGDAVVNGTTEQDWADVVSACAHPAATAPSGSLAAIKLRPSFGLHPWHVGNRSPEWDKTLRSYLDQHPSAGLGEIGLDRWILDRARPDDPRLAGLRRAPLAEQLEVFEQQLRLGAERDLPTTVHCLDAFGALHDCLRRAPRPTRGFLLHAYAGSVELAVEFAKLGAFFSFNGSFLDPRKPRMRALFTALPIDRLLLESDGPAMPPPDFATPFPLPRTADGARVNHPANVVAAYAALAEWRGMAIEQLAAQLDENFRSWFGS